MTRTSPRTALWLPLTAVGALGLAGCGAGLNAQTYQPRINGESVNADAGSLSIRHMYVDAPTIGLAFAEGGAAGVTLTVTNQADAEDVLVSASSPAAASVVVEAADGAFTIPAGGVSDPDDGLRLQGLTALLPSSTYVPITLVFASGTTSTVLTPVASPRTEPDTVEGYEAGETDSNGDPLPHSEEGGASEGGASEGESAVEQAAGGSAEEGAASGSSATPTPSAAPSASPSSSLTPSASPTPVNGS